MAHTLAMPSARGKPMLRLMRWGFSVMFTATDCIEVVTQIPDGNENAKAWSDLAGFRNTFKRKASFWLLDKWVDSQFRSLDYGAWVTQDLSNRTAGQAFHDLLAEKTGFHSHPDEAIHDAWVGATMRLASEQNLLKGVALYNRWAATAGYYQATILGTSPPVVDTGDAVIQMLSGNISVLSARRAPLDTMESPSCPPALQPLSQ